MWALCRCVCVCVFPGDVSPMRQWVGCLGWGVFVIGSIKQKFCGSFATIMKAVTAVTAIASAKEREREGGKKRGRRRETG